MSIPKKQNDPNPSKKSPDWLKLLETQSWQAELIISGLVITGLFRLPDWIVDNGQRHILNSTVNSAFFVDMAVMVFILAAFVLSLLFVWHFIMRAIWIALLGLNSVYPQGINPESELGLGAKYWKKAKQKYPNLTEYNQVLDEQCSLIFSRVFNLAIMILSFSLLIFAFYLCYLLIITILPSFKGYAVHIGIALYLVFAVVTLLIQYTAKKFPNNVKVERFLEAYSEFFSGVFSLYVFKKPNSYISGILNSNTKPNKLVMVVIMLISGLLGFAAASQTKDNPIYTYFSSASRYVIFNNRPEELFSFNYENLRNSEIVPFTPFIQSDVIVDDFIKLFIPTIEREKASMGIKDLSILEKVKMSRVERNEFNRQQLSKYLAFNQITLNDKSIDITDAHYHAYDPRVDDGILAYIATADCKVGKNILQIKKNYHVDGVQKVVTIPFYFQASR